MKVAHKIEKKQSFKCARRQCSKCRVIVSYLEVEPPTSRVLSHLLVPYTILAAVRPVQHRRPPVVIRIDIVEQAMLTAGIPTARQVVRVISRTPTSSCAKGVGSGVRPSNSTPTGDSLNFWEFCISNAAPQPQQLSPQYEQPKVEQVQPKVEQQWPPNQPQQLHRLQYAQWIQQQQAYQYQQQMMHMYAQNGTDLSFGTVSFL